MKEDIQKSVTEMIDKSGVEIDADERQKIVGEAIDAALEHIAQVLKTVSLAEGSSYMWVWIRFGESPELPGIKRGLTLSGTKTHVKQRFLPLTPLLMVSDVLWSPVLPA
uniref:hypothetical protein n=1 Tax=Enterobacter cloacae TaxID=550 RepID=UPI00155D9C59|nr:hypothetical protein [Enterobacter cloacae]